MCTSSLGWPRIHNVTLCFAAKQKRRNPHAGSHVLENNWNAVFLWNVHPSGIARYDVLTHNLRWWALKLPSLWNKTVLAWSKMEWKGTMGFKSKYLSAFPSRPSGYFQVCLLHCVIRGFRKAHFKSSKTSVFKSSLWKKSLHPGSLTTNSSFLRSPWTCLCWVSAHYSLLYNLDSERL